MAENLWYNDIDRNVDWGGDSSTGGDPVAGSVVQKFIKSELNAKIGVIYHDEYQSKYLCFAHQDALDEYLEDNTKTELILASFEAPSTYSAEIDIKSGYYNAILLGQTGNRLEFGFDIKNSAGQSQIDNITYEIVFTRNANKYTVHGSCRYGEIASLNIDEYLTLEGTTTATITVTGVTTGVSISKIATYDVVNLEIKNTHDVSKVYEKWDPLVISYSIFGSSPIKYVEWYIDGILIETDQILGGIIEPEPKTKWITLSDYSAGVHNLQFKAYVEINGERFETDTYYRDFIVNDSDINQSVIALSFVVPGDKGIIAKPELYNVFQFETCTFNYGVYNKSNLEYIPVEIYIDNKLIQTVHASNGKELSYSFVPSEEGVKTITLKTNEYTCDLIVHVNKTTMDLLEVKDGLELSLSAVGRSNNDSNLTDWSYRDYTTQFSGFNWNETSGWNDNRLVIGENMSITTNIAPLLDNTYGKTLEFEFETINVIDDDAVICDMRDDRGLGLLITASEASLKVGFSDEQVVYTKFKSNEKIRISFVINSNTKLALIYINGIVSGAVKYTSSFSVNKPLMFKGNSNAGIKLKQILIFRAILTSDQILNNYILYRDTVDEMIALYDRNNIVENSLFSVDKISQHIPVMLITGDVASLEAQSSTDAQTAVDIEYIADVPTRNFKMKGACLRIQGTSSASYPKKNYRIYTQRKKFNTTLYDYLGNVVEDKKYAFKDGSIPVDCWCIKADYAESSGTHNTGIATLWNDVMYNALDSSDGYVCRTDAQKSALANDYQYDVRTTVDGFPIVVFARQTENDEYLFIGKYNFNNDKSTPNIFGFTDIPGFDNSRMQCWELLENGNKYALFKTTENWYDQATDDDGKLQFDEDEPVWNWATGFEARYPDDGYDADTTDLKAFADWLLSCDSTKFYNEKKDHIDIWKMAAYYVYLLRFGAVDQVVKNSMLTSEDGQRWYFINYDNDTILGLKNTGALTYPPTITRDTMDGDTTAYAGRESRLWNFLENDPEFMQYVSKVDSLLYESGLDYETVLKYFNENQSDKWCERVYNKDAEYKYIEPATTISATQVDKLSMMQGSRKAHRTWWLAKRFKLMDGKFGNKRYDNQFIEVKLNGSPGVDIRIVAGEYMYYGVGSNDVTIQKGVELNKDDPKTFTHSADKIFAVGDPVKIFAPYAIQELDLSHVTKYLEELYLSAVNDPVLGTRLKKLILAPIEGSSQVVKIVDGLTSAVNLEHLDIRGLNVGTLDFSNLKLLKKLYTKGSGLTELHLPDGCAIDYLQLCDSLQILDLRNLPNLTFDSIEGFRNIRIPNISIHGCDALTNNFSYYNNWVKDVKEGDSLVLSGIHWKEISPDLLIQFGKVKQAGATLSLSGKIEISNPTLEQVNEIQNIFGEDCFINNTSLWIYAPESLFIHGVDELRSGDSYTFKTTIFSEDPGTVEWVISEGAEYVSSIVSNPDNTGTIYTIEDTESDHLITVQAWHKPKGSTYYVDTEFTFTLKKTIYATSGRIIGNATIKKREEFNLAFDPADWNGDYSTKWLVEGESFNNGSIVIASTSNDTCVIDYLETVIFDLCTLIAEVTNKNGSTFRVELPITVSDETVLLTSTSNPAAMRVCYQQGWSAKTDTNHPEAIIDPENVMYKWQAWFVDDVGTAFSRLSDLTSFNEFAEFKNVKIIKNSAFYQCPALKEIILPSESLYRIESYAFGSTGLKSLTIPTLVSDIHYAAFRNTPLEEIKVSAANITYNDINGILCSAANELVYYPKDRLDEEYSIPESIVRIGTEAFYQTEHLKVINIPDSVVSFSSRFINDNRVLEVINIGSGITSQNLAQNISANSRLQNINVSDRHPSLCSVDGIVYDINKSILWKFPEGRFDFVFEPSVTKIGDYAFQACLNLNGTLIMPDQIEMISTNGIYGCINIEAIEFTENSSLHTLGTRALQLSSKLNRIVLPASLKTIGQEAFSGCSRLWEIQFFGTQAPVFSDVTVSNGVRSITSAFGTNANTFTGYAEIPSNSIYYAAGRKIYVKTNATGFTNNEDWTNSILSPDRNKFGISQTL